MNRIIRKFIFISLALVFAFGIFGASVYRISAQTVAENMEKEGAQTGDEVLEEATAEAQVKEPVNYTLPWPGILPDHFLYPLKMIRDRIWLALTTDPLDKAELLLKMADKRVWASQMLLEKDKEDKALSTAAKAGNYLERAVAETKVAGEKGKEVNFMWEKLNLASQKHQEVYEQMKGGLSESGKNVMEEVLNYPEAAWQESQKAMSG